MLSSQLTPPFTHFPPPSYNTLPSVYSVLVQPGILSAITPSTPSEIPSGLHSDLSRQRVSSRPRPIAPRPTLDTFVSTRPCLPTVSGSGEQLPLIHLALHLIRLFNLECSQSHRFTLRLALQQMNSRKLSLTDNGQFLTYLAQSNPLARRRGQARLKRFHSPKVF
jgi:hypothetical protein